MEKKRKRKEKRSSLFSNEREKLKKNIDKCKFYFISVVCVIIVILLKNVISISELCYMTVLRLQNQATIKLYICFAHVFVNCCDSQLLGANSSLYYTYIYICMYV